MADAVQIRLVLENEQLTKQLRDTERKMAGLESKFRKSTNSMSESFAAFTSALVIPTAVIAGIVGVALAVQQTAKAVADLNDKALSLGISFENFQVLEYGASQAGTSIDKVSASIARLQVAIGKAAEDGGESIFSKLGLDVKQLMELEPDRQFEKISMALAGIQDPALKAAAASEIFGRGFRELIPLIDETAKGLDNMAAEAQASGVIIDEVTKNKLAKFDDAWEKLALKGRTLKASFFAPVASYLNEILTPALDSNLSAWQRLTQAMEQAFIYGAKVQNTAPPKGFIDNDEFNRLVAVSKLAPKFDWSNFNPPPPKAFVPPKVKTGSTGAAAAGKQAVKEFQEAFVANWDPISKLIADAGTDEDRRVYAYWEERGAIIRAGLEAGLRADDPIVQQLLDAKDADFNSIADKVLAAGNAAAPALEKIRDSMFTAEDAMKEFAFAAEDAFMSVVTGAQSAGEAVKQLLAQILIAIAQAALLTAINGGSFMSNLGGIVGGRSAGPQSGPTIRVFNYAGAGGVQTRRRSNGDTDLIIGQLATAISQGGNQLDKAMRRTYGIGRQGV